MQKWRGEKTFTCSIISHYSFLCFKFAVPELEHEIRDFTSKSLSLMRSVMFSVARNLSLLFFPHFCSLHDVCFSPLLGKHTVQQNFPSILRPFPFDVAIKLNSSWFFFIFFCFSEPVYYCLKTFSNGSFTVFPNYYFFIEIVFA